MCSSLDAGPYVHSGLLDLLPGSFPGGHAGGQTGKKRIPEIAQAAHQVLQGVLGLLKIIGKAAACTTPATSGIIVGVFFLLLVQHIQLIKGSQFTGGLFGFLSGILGLFGSRACRTANRVDALRCAFHAGDAFAGQEGDQPNNAVQQAGQQIHNPGDGRGQCRGQPGSSRRGRTFQAGKGRADTIRFDDGAAQPADHRAQRRGDQVEDQHTGNDAFQSGSKFAHGTAGLLQAVVSVIAAICKCVCRSTFLLGSCPLLGCGCSLFLCRNGLLGLSHNALRVLGRTFVHRAIGLVLAGFDFREVLFYGGSLFIEICLH